MLGEKYSFDYLRLSKEDGDVADGKSDESQSIASQRACIRQYRMAHPDLPKQFEELVDDGYSGTHFMRPGIQKILKLVEQDMVDTIIVRDLSRFARNYLDAGHYLEFVFPAHNVRFISINDGYDSADYSDASAGLHVAIKNLINQMYSRDISRKIKSAVDLKKMSGAYVYGTAPYGYKKGSMKNTIVVDEPAAQVVNRIFRLACSGEKITQICRILNDEGVITPSVYLASVRGKYKTRPIWTYESIRNILTNRIYTGDTVPFKSHVVTVGSDRVKQVNECDQIVLPDTHEAIITREMFFLARKVVSSNKKSPSGGRSSVLSSYLVCGCCGNKLVKGKRTNKSFLCTSARYLTEGNCKAVRCNEEKMKAMILRAIHQQIALMDTNLQLIRSVAKAQKREADTIRNGLRFQRRREEGILSAKMALYEEYVANGCTKEDYVERKLKLDEQEKQVKQQIAALEELEVHLNDNEVNSELIDAGGRIVNKYIAIKELDDEVMRELVCRVVVYPNDSIQIEWNFKDLTDELRIADTSVI